MNIYREEGEKRQRNEGGKFVSKMKSNWTVKRGVFG